MDLCSQSRRRKEGYGGKDLQKKGFNRAAVGMGFPVGIPIGMGMGVIFHLHRPMGILWRLLINLK